MIFIRDCNLAGIKKKRTIKEVGGLEKDWCIQAGQPGCTEEKSAEFIQVDNGTKFFLQL